MSKILRKLFSLVLVLSMLVALMPVNALSVNAVGDTPENLALAATVTSNNGLGADELATLKDGDCATSIWVNSTAGEEITDYYEFQWATPISVDQVTLVATKARNQAPTSWRVEVLKDGETEWAPVGTVSDMAWTDLGDVKETKDLAFKNQKSVKGIRVYILDANREWNGYAVQEFEIFNKTNGNLAVGATVTSNNGLGADKLATLKDGDRGTEIWANSDEGTAIADYYQLNWANPISADKINMVVTKGRNQAPTSWRVEVSRDGETGWTEVASISDVAWLELGDVKETKDLAFAFQQDIKGIRVYIENANRTWDGYSIIELEVYQVAEGPADPGPQNPQNPAPAVPANGNYASISTVTSNVNVAVEELIDGDHTTNIWSAVAAGATISDYYQFNWENPVSVNQVVLVATKARHQAPTAWRIEVSKDGESGWTKVSSIKEVAWLELGDVKETKDLTFNLQKDIKGMRIYIEDANRTWDGYAVYEFEIYKTGAADKEDAAPKNGNYAPIANISSNVANDVDRLASLIDGNHEAGIWRKGITDGAKLEDYYQLNWDTPVTINQLKMVVTKARNQAPITWRVEVSKDGETGWTKVATVSKMEWLHLDGNKEIKDLAFNLQKDIKGIRVYVEGANAAWGGYAIQELEVYNIKNPQTGDGMSFVPFALTMFVSAGVAVCTFVYKEDKKRGLNK